MTDSNSGSSLVTVVEAQRLSDDTFARVRALIEWVRDADDSDLHNTVIPSIQQAGIPGALQESIVKAVHRKLKFADNELPIGKLRALLFPPALTRTDGELPEWAKPYCWVTSQDAFFNTENAEFMSLRSFDIAHGRRMPVGESGRRLSAAERCTQFWSMPIVERVGYRPDCGPFYTWDGVSYANLYSPTSLPAESPPTPRGEEGIRQFQLLLFEMCGRRVDVYHNLLCWMAHNVQKPGVKIRWSPILKGVHGDGKTLAAAVLRAAMGYRNVSTTSNSNIANSGNFTDWSVRGAVNVIEEIMLTGKLRHQLYNSMKEFISNNIVDINPKGAKPYQAYNTTNHWANTNHNDAIPLERTDRRWMVVFTPWSSLDEMLTYCGLDAAGWKARTDAIDHAKNHCAGELRAWFLSVSIPSTFDVNGSAPVTPEKRRMMASSKDDVESVVESIIAEGGAGITDKVVSTAHLSRLLTQRAPTGGYDVPKTTALTFMLARLGYSKLDKQVKWRGETLRVWVKDGVELTPEDVRSQLDNSLPHLLPGQTLMPQGFQP